MRKLLLTAAQKLQNEIHAWKKERHYWEIMRKDGEACRQISANTLENLKAAAEFPGFEAQYSIELTKRGLKKEAGRFATQAA